MELGLLGLLGHEDKIFWDKNLRKFSLQSLKSAKHWKHFWVLSKLKAEKHQGRISALMSILCVYFTCEPPAALEMLPQLWITVREPARPPSLAQTIP